MIVEHDFFWKIVPNWVYFGQREDFKLTKELPEKREMMPQPGNQKPLNEAILVMSINEALLSIQNFVPFKKPRFNSV